MDRQSFLFWMDQDAQPSSKIAMKLSNTEPFFVRLTGGCGFMDPEDGKKAINALTKALSGLNGALLYGGTRVLAPSGDRYRIFPTILEVPPRLRKANPGLMTFGIIPRMINCEYTKLGLIIGRDPKSGFLTVIHPNQDVCLVLQKNVDQISFWDAERIACLQIVRDFLENRNGFTAVLVSYNGGEVTGREIEDWAEANLPVILFAGSGRKTDEFCQNHDWLSKHPSVIVCHTVKQARNTIQSLGGTFS